MAAIKILIVLLGASVLVMSQQEKLLSDMAGILWGAEVAWKPGETFRDRLKIGGEGPEMVVIPAGIFRMGDIQGIGGSEQPVHDVHIRRPFAISRYEIT